MMEYYVQTVVEHCKLIYLPNQDVSVKRITCNRKARLLFAFCFFKTVLSSLLNCSLVTARLDCSFECLSCIFIEALFLLLC